MSIGKTRLDMVNEYRAELKAVHGLDTRVLTAEDFIGDVWELVDQLEEALRLLELAEELLDLRDKGAELQARLKRRQEEYDALRPQVMKRACSTVDYCGPYPWYRPADAPTTESDPPGISDASALRARLQRGKAKAVRHDR